MLALHQHPAQKEWAAANVAGLPCRWRKRLLSRWETTRNGGATSADNRAAAYELQDTVARLAAVTVPLDAADSDICARAETLAAHCRELGGVFGEWALRSAIETVCRANNVAPPYIKKRSTAESEVKRAEDALWWRRQLRKVHAKAVEGSAVALGYVNKTRDIYVSNESVARRRQQNKRNAAMLEATKARNDAGQEFTLAELAAKGTSNKAIKRGELMTRIAGFERIAVDCEHAGLFFTVTCPSRMHKWRTVAGGRAVENKKYDGTLPGDAQSHVARVWQRIRAALDRAGFAWYGFRIAEPNHDGTPHWHVLVFFAKQWPGAVVRAALPRVCAIIRRYALGRGEVKEPELADVLPLNRFPYRFKKDAEAAWLPKAVHALHEWRVAERRRQNAERGAKKHRVDFKPMDASKGTAAGYIAKYVAKNIDGYGIEQDLFGNDAVSTSRRVEAWAATWGIRQFQQVGGPPVTVWRELRRVKELPEDAPEHLSKAHSAVNKVALVEGEKASVAWDRYCQAQGGVFCGRSYRIKVAVEEQDGTGRYGEALAPRPVGVETEGEVTVKDGICTYKKPMVWLVKSARWVWEIIRNGSGKGNAGIARAWTCVNNCTRDSFAELRKRVEAVPELFGPLPKISNFEFFGPLNWPEMEKGLN